MNKNFMIATLVGAVVLFIVGYLLYGLALAGFYETNVGSATGVMKETPEWLWLILSMVAYAAVLTLILGWAGAKDPAGGFRIAAIVGLLFSASVDFGQYSMMNLMNLTVMFVDPFVGAIHAGVGGAVIGMMLGKGGD
ncbi:MAG: hypothetical protein ACC682_12030 [Gemmatimonadota bacterium]